MQRNDLRGASLDIPRDLQEACLRFGGKNPFDEPIYRLVIAETRVVKMGGVFKDWDPSIPMELREGFETVEVELEVPEPVYADVPGKGRKLVGYNRTAQVKVPTDHKPIREVEEVREVAKYPGVEGIVLERWFPASSFGTRIEWEAQQTPGGLPLLGPYPDRGEYEMVSDVRKDDMPTVSKLRDVISFWERNLENRGDSPETRRRQRIYAQEEQLKKDEKRVADEIYHRLMENTGILLGSSLAAGRIRQQMAERAGLRGHFGN